MPDDNKAAGRTQHGLHAFPPLYYTVDNKGNGYAQGMNFNFFRKSGSDTTNRQIFRAALIVCCLGVVAKLVGIIKELVVARAFGRSDDIDAFLIAFLLPSFVLNIGMGSLGYALVPVFVETRENLGVEHAYRLLGNIISLMQ